jgi:hypothetical protein
MTTTTFFAGIATSGHNTVAISRDTSVKRRGDMRRPLPWLMWGCPTPRCRPVARPGTPFFLDASRVQRLSRNTPRAFSPPGSGSTTAAIRSLAGRSDLCWDESEKLPLLLAGASTRPTHCPHPEGGAIQ